MAAVIIYNGHQDIKLIKITFSEIRELQDLSRQTFIETYALKNTKENIEDYLSNSFTFEKLSEEINNPNSEFYFAKTGNKSIGYLKVNLEQAQTELQDSKALEIERIYVLQEYHGKKTGQMLLGKAFQIANHHNIDYIWLGVWEKNPEAIKFYKKNGFIQFGKHIFKVGDDEQTDIMMKLDLKN